MGAGEGLPKSDKRQKYPKPYKPQKLPEKWARHEGSRLCQGAAEEVGPSFFVPAWRMAKKAKKHHSHGDLTKNPRLPRLGLNGEARKP